MAYAREQIEKEIKSSLIRVDTFYKEKFINYVGKTKDTQEFYSEVIASKILNNPSLFESIKKNKRGDNNNKSYLTKSHQNRPLEIKNTNREEEKYAKRLFNEKDFHLGEVIDFQIPLKNQQSDKLGKIDLMTFNKSTLTLYLIELKYGKNKETLLRAILEAHTYYKIIDKDKLKSDFGLNEVKDIKPAVMAVGLNCNSYKELDDIKNRPELAKLAKQLDMTFFKSADEVTFEIINAANL